VARDPGRSGFDVQDFRHQGKLVLWIHDPRNHEVTWQCGTTRYRGGQVSSEFEVRRFAAQVNRGIASVDFPIGRSPTKSGRVDPLTFGVQGFVLHVNCACMFRDTVKPDLPRSEGKIAEGCCG
jgi:hypothetical protein